MLRDIVTFIFAYLSISLLENDSASTLKRDSNAVLLFCLLLSFSDLPIASSAAVIRNSLPVQVGRDHWA